MPSATPNRVPPPQPIRPTRHKSLILAMVVVCGVVAAAHWPVLSAQALSLDDQQYLVENLLVQNPGWSSAGCFFSEVLHPSTVRGYYQPLAMVSLMLDYAIGWRPNDLRPFHRTSLALHVANVALIVVLLYVLFEHVWAAAMVGLLFGVHPLTVESVAWVAERKTLLATLFALACLASYVRTARRPSRTWYGLCVVLYVLALLSKPTSTPLPVLLLLLDYWPLRRLSWRTVREKVPLFAIGIASAVVTVVSQGRAAGLEGGTQSDAGRILLTVCHNIVFYLRTTVWPVRLTWHYPFPEPLGLSQPAVLAGVIGTAVVLGTLLVSWRWTRAALTGWLFFFVAIFPTMGLIGFTYIIAAHRFAYLPVVGLLLPLTALLAWLWKRARGAGTRRATRLAILAVTTGLAAAEIRLTQHDLSQWQDTERLHRYMLTITPDAYAIGQFLGSVLLEHDRIAEAEHEFEHVLRIRPDNWAAHTGLASICERQARPDEAIRHLQEAIRLNPNYYPAQFNLANLLASQNRYADAVAHYREAQRIRPGDYRVHLNLGNVLAAQGQFEQALSCYAEALRLKPRYARGHLNRGITLTKLGRVDEAIAEFRAALAIDPNNPAARVQLEAALKTGRP